MTRSCVDQNVLGMDGIPNLLQDMCRTRYDHNPDEDWPEFYRRVRRLIRDSMRLKKDKQGMALEVYERRKARIRKRLDEFIDQEWKQKHARRLPKRLRCHREELLTLLDHDEVPPDNNGGERGFRPAVRIRKIQLRQRQQGGITDPGCADDHHAHPQDARTQPRADPGRGLEILCPFRKTSTVADKTHGKRLKGYGLGIWPGNRVQGQ